MSGDPVVATTSDAVHLHARCRTCGTVVDLPVDLLDEVTHRVGEANGFDLEPGHVALSGRCATCRAADHD